MVTTPEAISIRVEAGQAIGELSHNWNYIGYDEINYTYTPEGRELLGKFGALAGEPYYVRTHHLFCTGNCHGFYKWGSTNAYLEDEDGSPIYNWAIVDLVFDTILQSGAKPFVELGFMPQQLADPQHYDLLADNWVNGNYRAYGFASPPKDYRKWHDLVFECARHCVERYGLDEVRTWYWELWNEPDLDYYWRGTIEEYNQLYDYTAAAIKAVDPELRVGGPGTTNPISGGRSAEYLDKFLAHCVDGVNACTGQRGVPLDFVSFHVKGGGYRADLHPHDSTPPSRQQILRCLEVGYAIIAQYPGLAQLECILSEIDPDGWAAGGVWDNPVLNFRNTEYYPSFVAATFDRVTRFGQQHQWDVRLLSWAFLFVGERCFEGTRAFSTQGIDKAILNLFRLYDQLGTQQVRFESSGDVDPLRYADVCGRGEAGDVSGFATLTDSGLAILIYHQHDDWSAAGEVEIALKVAGLPSGEMATVTHYRIDHEHSSAYSEWVRQGQPMYPSPEQRQAIEARSGLETVEPPRKVTLDAGQLRLQFRLPVHGVSLLSITP